MQTTHKVQAGDTLSAIANHYQTTVRRLQSVNPKVTNKDHIQVGWELIIPANEMGQSSQKTDVLRAPRSTGSEAKGQASCTECTDDYTEIIHVTGAGDGKWCVALPQNAADFLLKEIDEVDALMAEFKSAQDAVHDPESSEISPKRRWMDKAAEMGVIEPEPEASDEENVTKASTIQSQIAAIDEQIQWYNDYDPDYYLTFARPDAGKRESIERAAKEKRLAMLREERNKLVANLEKGSASTGVKGTGISSNEFLTSRSNSKERGFVSQRRTKREIGIVEVMVFSRPGRWHYIRREAYRRLVTEYGSIRYVRKTKSISNMLRDRTGTAKALFGQIRDGIAADAAKSPLGNIEVKFAEASDDFYLLGEEHSKLTWKPVGEHDCPIENNFQVSAEAHLMRFAMQASAGVNAFNLSEGEIDIGTKASASLALVEAEAKLAEVFVPNEAGWDCRFTYRNRGGELADLAFGAFRFSGDITLNCFAGGRASGEANVRLSSGAASFLLSENKKVEASPNAGLAVTGDAFAGAEAGGAIAGKFSWVHPEEQYRKNADWQDLFNISIGGTLAVGAGAGFDFELRFLADKIYFVCKGRLVFGPGASGSFGCEIGADKVWNLAKTIFEVLSEVDYQYLSNIQAELFHQWARSLYLSFSESATDLIELLSSPAYVFNRIWAARSERKVAAESLANNIIDGAKGKEKLEDLAFNGLPYHQLPPETLGMMMSTLCETFIDSWEEKQETALLILVSQIRTWRKFFETLEHMSEGGEKVDPMDSLRKLTAILDDGSTDSQLSQFQNWILSDLAIKPTRQSLKLAWSPIPINQKINRLVARLDMLNQTHTSHLV